MRGSLPAAFLLFLAVAIAAAAGPAPEPADPDTASASLQRPPSGPASGKDLPSVLPVIQDAILETDTDGDGVPDVSDCRPFDETLWGIPSAVTDLTITGDAPTTLEWSEPADPGGETVFYDLLMSGSAGSWEDASCLLENSTSLTASDWTMPGPGDILHYLVRTKNACGENLGEDSSGTPRSGSGCAPFPKPDGESCTVNVECMSTYCTDDVCCASECGGLCESCDQAGNEGFCEPIPGGTDPNDECAYQDPFTCGTTGDCDGAGGCALYPDGTICGERDCDGLYATNPPEQCDGLGTCQVFASQLCMPYACNPLTGSCFTACLSTAQCFPGYECRLPEEICLLPLGSSCTGDLQCVSGYCTDGVCCSSDACGLCERCDQAGYLGDCHPVPAGTDPGGECATEDPSTCGQTGDCDGAGGCALYPAGEECSPSGPCVSPSEYEAPDLCDGAGTCADGGLVDCTPYACEAGACLTTCAAHDDCAPNYLCKLPEGICLLDTGQACTDPSQCYLDACCSLVCTDLSSDEDNCGACGAECLLYHASQNNCGGGNCYPTCIYPWGNCDSDGHNGCETPLTTTTDCGSCGTPCDPWHSTGTCSTGSCQIAYCDDSYADCNGSVSDGCEWYLPTYLNYCSNPYSVGSMCGDSRCGWPWNCDTTSWYTLADIDNYGNRWYRGYAEECSACTADVYARITLYPAAYTDYDLYVYSPCGTLVASSTNRGASPDAVLIGSEDRLANNDSFYYYIEVRWISGNLCDDWNLVVEGRGTCDE